MCRFVCRVGRGAQCGTMPAGRGLLLVVKKNVSWWRRNQPVRNPPTKCGRRAWLRRSAVWWSRRQCVVGNTARQQQQAVLLKVRSSTSTSRLPRPIRKFTTVATTAAIMMHHTAARSLLAPRSSLLLPPLGLWWCGCAWLGIRLLRTVASGTTTVVLVVVVRYHHWWGAMRHRGASCTARSLYWCLQYQYMQLVQQAYDG